MDAATIDGQVDCREGHFATKSGPALQCNSARIGGNFICDGALFFSSTKYAINADDVRIGSDLDLRYGFCTNAIVWLQNATINGTLDCIAGSISSSNDFALVLNSATIAGNAFFRDFIGEGGVDLRHAKVGGDLDCGSGQFRRNIKQGFALAARVISIGHNLRLDNGFYADGEVLLETATIGGDLICDGGKISNDGANDDAPDAFNGDGMKIAGRASLNHRFAAKGRVIFKNSYVGHAFVLKDIDRPEDMDLDLRFAKVGTLSCAKDSWPNKGALHLHGFLYDDIDTEARPEDVNLQLQWISRGEAQSTRKQNGFYSSPESPNILDSVSLSHQKTTSQISNEFLPQPYEQLARTLRSMGLEDAAAKVLIDKNRDEGDDAITRDRSAFAFYWNSIPGGWSKALYANIYPNWAKILWDVCWYKGLGKLIDYGYSPWHAFYASLFIIVVGSVIFKLGYTTKVIIPSADNAYETVTGWTHKFESNSPRQLKETYPRFNAFIYSLETFVPLVKLGIEEKWIPRANNDAAIRLGFMNFHIPGTAFLWYRWIHILLGWVFTTLWVGGFTGLIKN